MSVCQAGEAVSICARERHGRWGYETHGICRGVTDGGHDGEEDMLLDGEGAGVNRDAKDLDVGDDACPETAKGEGEQLGDNLHASRSAIGAATTNAQQERRAYDGEKRGRWGRERRRKREDTHTTDGDGGVPEEEELVHAGDEDGPDDSDEPSTEGAGGHVRVVGVGDGGAHLGVGRVVLCACGEAWSARSGGRAGGRGRTEEGGILVKVGVVKLRDGDDGGCGGKRVRTGTGTRRRRGRGTDPASRHRASRRWSSRRACPRGGRPWRRATRRGGRGGPARSPWHINRASRDQDAHLWRYRPRTCIRPA